MVELGGVEPGVRDDDRGQDRRPQRPRDERLPLRRPGAHARDAIALVGVPDVSRSLDGDGLQSEFFERRARDLVSRVRGGADPRVELDEGGEVLAVRHAAAAGSGAEPHADLARHAPEHDVLVLLARRRLGLLGAEDQDPIARKPGGGNGGWNPGGSGIVNGSGISGSSVTAVR